MAHGRCAIIAVVVLSAGCSSAEVAAPNGGNGGSTPRVTLAPDRDNTLYEDPGGALSNGAGQFLFVGSTSTTNQGLLRRHWSTSTSPAGASPPGLGSTASRSSSE